MSTKAINRLLMVAGNGCLPTFEEVSAALKETKAIERAAKVMDTWNRDGQKRLDPEMAKAWGLIESIAKDAP